MEKYPDPRMEKDETGYASVQSRMTFYKGKKIFEEGTTGTQAYYIEKGKVQISVKEGDHDVIVSELEAGEIIGEMALITHEPRTATVTAVEDTTVTVISSSKFEQKLMMLEDKAIKTLIYVLVERLKEANKGQARHYRSLIDFQKRVTGMAQKIEQGVDETRTNELRSEIEPLLDRIDSVLNKYSK